MMGFFSNLFAKQNCAVCGKECGTPCDENDRS